MTSRSPEIEALIRRLFASRASGDSDAILNLFSDSEHFLAVGSEEGEIWQGAEARALVTGTWAHKPEEVDEVVQVEARENGSVGWAAVEGRRLRPELPPYSYHFTVVLNLEGGAWKVVLMHFSVLVPEEHVNAVDLTPGLSGLLESLEETAFTTGGSRTGTVMFTDIVDSTALSQALGDGAWASAIGDHMRALRKVVGDCGGRVVKTLGDGAMFVFPSGASALDAATRIQRELSDDSEGGIRVRVGIHTGDLMESDSDLLGLTVHKAARVAAAAGAGQVLASATTVGMVNQNEYPFGEPVSVELKGLDGTHVLYPLDWRSVGAGDSRTVDEVAHSGA